MTALVFAASTATASERHFAYTYETTSLAAGTGEAEPTVTVRTGRQQFYTAVDYRLEFEGGVTDRLMAAVYLNGRGEASGDGASRGGRSEFSGFSTELKYRLLDRVADPLGLALYGELTVSSQLLELEAKLLVDKRIGRLLVAANLVFEHEWIFLAYETRRQIEAEIYVAAGIFVTEELVLGLELRNYNRISMTPEVAYQASVLFAGPSLSYSVGGWWLAMSVMPQLGAFLGASRHDVRDLDTQEMLTARLIVGVHF